METGDVCIPGIHSNMISVGNKFVTVPLSCAATVAHSEPKFKTEKKEEQWVVREGIKLEKRDKNGNFKIIPNNADESEYSAIITYNGEGSPEDWSGKFDLSLYNLQPGTLYKLTVQD